MNIFVLHTDCFTAAQYHCDQHVRKMILEAAQMLSSCCRYYDIPRGYKSTHINHPCSVWVRQSEANFIWLRNLAFYLNQEYKRRFKKKINHKSWEVIVQLPIPDALPKKRLTPFAQAMPEDFKGCCAVDAYREYYRIIKQWTLQRFTYTNTSRPRWL